MLLKLIKLARKASLRAILPGLLLVLPSAAFAGIEVLFSPRDNINYRIIEAIDISVECIDVTTFDFTSREIADALINARRKGLEIRLLVNKEMLEDEDTDSQAKHLEEIGFNIKALKGKDKGGMKNSFIIFDGRLVIVGPYHLTEDKESYNYENAIFFDDPGIVETYQNEFDRLFGKRSILKTSQKKPKDSLLSTIIKPSSNLRQGSGSIPPEKPEKSTPPDEDLQPREDVVMPKAAPAPPPIPAPPSSEGSAGIEAQPSAEEHTEPSEVKIAAKDKEPVIEAGAQAQETKPETLDTLGSEDTIQSPFPLEPTPTHGSFMEISFTELDKIFGSESTLSEAEKEALWPRYIGRYVKWTGEVTYTLLGFFKGTRIGLRHKEGSDTDVEVKFRIRKVTKIIKIAEGDTITYTAKLFTQPTSETPYYVLDEGTLE